MIIDTPQITTHQIVHLQADHIDTIIRYLDPIGPNNSKNVQPAEAKALAEVGIKLALVSEGWGDFAHGGISAGAGERDAQYALERLPLLGAPDNTCVFFAIDTDASPSQIGKLVIPYFTAIKQVFGITAYRIGVYGSGAVCQAVIQAKLVNCTWLSCSMGWSGSRVYLAAKPPELVLVQHTPTHLAGLDCDPDDALGDFGAFLAFSNKSDILVA